MCASSGTKVWLIKEAVCSSLYDSASSRAHAPHAGAALKSTSNGRFVVFASARAASASLVQLTSILIVLLAALYFDLFASSDFPHNPILHDVLNVSNDTREAPGSLDERFLPSDLLNSTDFSRVVLQL
jgi:hypothetical protein